MKKENFLNPDAWKLYKKYEEKGIELKFLWNHINGVYHSYNKLYVVKKTIYEKMRYSMITSEEIDRFKEKWEIVEEVESEFKNPYYGGD